MSEQARRLLVYRASAGSGKTFTLAARYIALLLGGVSFRSILAVTFTNKATAEMKQRIMNNLYKISIGELNESSHFMQKVMEYIPGGKLPSDLRATASNILTAILNDYDHFAISTIDSFLQILLAGLAHRLHYRANYEIDLDTDAVTDEAVDLMIKNYKNESDEVRREIDNYIEENLQTEKTWDIRKAVKSLARQLSKEDFLMNEEIVFESIATHHQVKEYRQKLHNHLEDRLTTPLKEYLDTFERDYSHYPWRAGVARSVKTFVRNIKAYLSSPYTAEMKNLADSVSEKLQDEAQWEKECDNSQDVIPSMHLLSKMDILIRENQQVINSVQLSLQHLHSLCLLRRVQELVDSIEREKDSTLLSKAPITLHKEMNTGDATFILEKAGIRYRHIMIDEFQDTSHLQWELFKPLVEEILDKGGTVLIVGDVKQSIYRWRGGDWQLLKEIDDTKQLGRYFSSNTGGIFPQKRNFRSHENIVRFNLSLFKSISEQMDSTIADTAHKGIIKTIYDEGISNGSLSDYYNTNHPGGYVRMDYYGEDCEPDTIIGNTLDQINRLVAEGVPMSAISILVRTHREAESIVEFLTRNHKPDNSGPYDHLNIVSAEAYLLSSSVSVNILINALRYIHTQNNIALFYIISRYQNDILGRNISWEEIRKHCQSQAHGKLLPQGFIEDIQDDGKTIARPDASLKDLPLYETVEKLARMFLYKDGRRSLTDDSYVLSLFDNVASFCQQKGSDMASFLEYWDDVLNAQSIKGAESGIQILTIHKAKGLENDTIFVPFCDFDIRNTNSSKNNIWCRPSEPPYNDIPLLPIETTKKMEESIYAARYSEEVFMQYIDSLNTLYVALTRAKKNLFISGKKKNRGDNILNYILNYLCQADPEHFSQDAIAQNSEDCISYETGKMILDSAEKTGNNINLQLQHLDGRFDFRQSSDSYSFLFPDKKKYNTEAAKHGQQLHLIYSAIDKKEDSDEVIDFFCKQGVIDSSREAEEIRQTIRNSWKNKTAASWFDGSWTLFKECNILEKDQEGNLRQHRPDRVMIKEEECIVIDFKFAQKSEEHIEQVRRYMTLMKKMGHQNITGYLWYIGEHTTETVEVTL